MRTQHPLCITLYIAFLVAVAPLSTDMYLPALPSMAAGWGSSQSLADLSLSLWFASFALTLLLYGPLSDKLGRKTIIFSGVSVFLVGSLGCALSWSMTSLIGFRILQAAGGASASAMGMAISRDLFDGPERQRILAWVSIILAVAPMVAPSLGSLILIWASWRGIFMAQALWGVLAIAATFPVRESLPPDRRNPDLRFLSRYTGLLRNTRFLLSTVLLCLVLSPFYTYIASSPHIFIETFGVSEQVFAGYFALNPLGTMIGAVLCERLSRTVAANALNLVGFAGMTLGGAAILLVSHSGAIWFALSMMATALFMGLSRPTATNLVLEQVDTDFGSASSFLIFCQFLFGALFMGFSGLGLMDHRDLLGGLALGVGLITLAAWPLLLRMIAGRGQNS